jgi:glycerol-3-phosphate dehydrogenase
VRPLFDDGASKASEVSRDYALELDRHDGRPPLLSIYGGKLTTYRKLAERALDMLTPVFPSMGPPWTAEGALPGGTLPEGGVDALVEQLRDGYPALDRELLRQLARRHGSLATEVLAGTRQGAGTGQHFGADLYAFEVDYFVRKEWALTAEDVLWRRTKSGLRLDGAAANALAAYLQQDATRRG